MFVHKTIRQRRLFRNMDFAEFVFESVRLVIFNIQDSFCSLRHERLELEVFSSKVLVPRLKIAKTELQNCIM
jgi:hypothetical protein